MSSMKNNSMKLLIHIILFFGIAFRLYFAITRTDLIWYDEHYQTLEPAGKVVWGFGHLVWEWVQGFRPWTGPAIFLPAFYLLKLLGVVGGPIAIMASRVWVAILSSLSLLVFHRWLKKLNFSDLSHFVALSLFALHSSFVLWGVSTLTDSLAFITFTLILPFAFERPASFRSGLLFGIVFLVRLQMLALMPGYGLFLLILKTPLKNWIQFSLGFLTCVLFMGGLDWITLGSPFHSLIFQLAQGAKIAADFGTTPAKAYLISFLETLGPVGWVAMFVMLVASFKSAERRTLWYFVSLPGLSLLVIHNLISHKEARFIVPMYATIFMWFAIGTEYLEKTVKSISQLTTSLLTPRCYCWITVALVGLSFWRGSAARIFTTGRDAFDLEVIMRTEGELKKPEIPHCVLLVGHHWNLTHGELLMGTPYQTFMIEKQELPGRPAKGCPYAMVKDTQISDFITSAPVTEHWVEVQKSKTSSIVLFKDPH